MAGTELATAYYSLVPSMAGTAAAVRTQSAGLAGVWGGIGDDAGKGLKGGMLGAVGKLAAPLAVAFAAIGIGNIVSSAIDTIGESVTAASNVAEAATAIDEVFGTSATAIEDFASRGATALGQSQLDILNASKLFGTYGAAAGLAGDDLASFSTDLVGLSTDLASFFNTTPQDAAEAIGAGLRGESEPLRQYGVLLDDATLKARALSLGIYDGNGSLTQQQRVLAAQAEIFAQTNTAQGDFARTSEGLANQQRILAANFENAKAKLGSSLLPAMTTLATFANDQLVPILGDLIDKVGPVLGDALTESAPAFADLLLAVAPLVPTLVELAAEVFPPFVEFMKIISPLLIDMATNTTSFWTAVNDVFSLLNGDTSLQTVAEHLLSLDGAFADTANGIGAFLGSASADMVAFASAVGAKIGEAISFVASLPGRAVAALGDLGSLFYGSGEALIQGFVDGIYGMLGAVGDAVGSVLDFAAGFFPNSPADHGPFSGAGWRRIEDSGYAVGDEFAAGLKASTAELTIGAVPRFETPIVSDPAATSAYSLATLQLLREIRDRVGIELATSAVQGATGSLNVATSLRGQAY